MGKSTAVVADKLLCGDQVIADYIKCTLPEIKWKTSTFTGGGIAGDIEVPLQGLAEAMNTQVDVRALGSENLGLLMSPGLKNLEYRFNRNMVLDSGKVITAGTRIYLTGMSTGMTGGNIERGATMEGNVTFSVTRFRWVEDGQELFLIDQLNQIYKVNGKDHSNILSL